MDFTNTSNIGSLNTEHNIRETGNSGYFKALNFMATYLPIFLPIIGIINSNSLHWFNNYIQYLILKYQHTVQFFR